MKLDPPNNTRDFIRKEKKKGNLKGVTATWGLLRKDTPQAIKAGEVDLVKAILKEVAGRQLKAQREETEVVKMRIHRIRSCTILPADTIPPTDASVPRWTNSGLIMGYRKKEVPRQSALTQNLIVAAET